MSLLAVSGLTIDLSGTAGPRRLVGPLAFTLDEGGSLGLMGASGAGKTLTALALLRLVPPPARSAGSIRFAGVELADLEEKAMRRWRGGGIGLVPQEPTAALTPVISVGGHLVELLRAHRPSTRRVARARALELLAEVALADPGQALGAYPHQLSGGERQRVALALALAGEPRLLIADEPTSALDTVTAAQIVDLLRRLRRQRGLALLLVSHELTTVAALCERVAVLDGGRLVEEAPVDRLVAAPGSPWARSMVAAARQLSTGEAGS